MIIPLDIMATGLCCWLALIALAWLNGYAKGRTHKPYPWTDAGRQKGMSE